jgi:EAL domain-containing protein (putative c-di-GMP-specific phosphodiesterase class I)
VSDVRTIVTATGTGDGSIVGAVISVTTGLRMQLEVECLETVEQVALLQQQSCSEAQRFDSSHPAGTDDITQLFSRGEFKRCAL